MNARTTKVVAIQRRTANEETDPASDRFGPDVWRRDRFQRTHFEFQEGHFREVHEDEDQESHQELVFPRQVKLVPRGVDTLAALFFLSSDADVAIQYEGEPRFRRHSDALAAGGQFDCRPAGATRGSPDGRTLPAA